MQSIPLGVMLKVLSILIISIPNIYLYHKQANKGTNKKSSDEKKWSLDSKDKKGFLDNNEKS